MGKGAGPVLWGSGGPRLHHRTGANQQALTPLSFLTCKMHTATSNKGD